MAPVLEVANIRKRFGGIAAVDGVSFEVREGEILGIIGPNGCGKSTLFNCILGQLPPSEGEVKLDGRVDDRHAPLRPQPARRQPHVSASADLPADSRCARISFSPARSTRARCCRGSSVRATRASATPPIR